MSGSYGGGHLVSEGDFGPFGSAFSRQPEQKTVFFGERWEVLVHRKIGDGGFGQVYRGNDRAWNPPVETACKRVVLANDLQRAAFETEVKILKKVHDHNFIITLYGEAIVDRDAWMFLELATGGELFDRLVDCGSLTERAAWPYFKAILQAVNHIHSRGVVHRDLKLENIMLTAEDPHAIRLIDFGLAINVRLLPNGKIDPTDNKWDCAGTQAYRAPEVSSGEYEPAKVDIWAMGIILFSLVAGFFPLKEAKLSEDWRFGVLQQKQANMRGGDGSCDAIFRMYKKLEGVPPDEQAAAAAATAAGSDGAHTPPPLPEPPAASSANSADYANPTNAAAADTAPGNPGKRPRIFGPEDATEAACHSPSSNASYGSDGRSSSLGGEGGASEGGPKRQAMRGVAPSAGRRGGENRAQHCGRANCYRCNERKYISCGADRKGAGSSPENDGLECPFSDLLKDLIDGMLCIDPQYRFDLNEINEHRWLEVVPPGKPLYDDTAMVYRGIGSDDTLHGLLPTGAVPLERQRTCQHDVRICPTP